MKTEDCDLDGKNVCYTKRDKDGRNERGCIKDEECKETDNCFKCKTNTDKCNIEIDPTTRPKCYQCSGRKCDNPETRKLTAEYCEFFDSKETKNCYTTNTKFNVIRGCIAGAKKDDISCEGQKNCTTKSCGESPASVPCNSNPVTLENKCFKCDSKSDSSCAKEFTKETFEDCKTEKGCYGRFKDGVASRGCAENLSEDELKACKDPKNEKCQFCDLPACNKDKINGSNIIIISNLILVSSILINWKFF